MRIAGRFCGPPGSANGGYCAGLIAKALTGAVEVTLRAPPPLEQPLDLLVSSETAELRAGEQLVAEARCAAVDVEVPPPPSFERAVEMSSHYCGHRRHHFPGCFVCGPAREAGDGLRIFPGAERGQELLAAPFRPDSSLGDVQAPLAIEFVWAALDCVGYFACAAPDYSIALLGRITAEVVAPIRIDEPCVVIGWSLGREGRKLQAGTAIFGADGRLCGRARQTWLLRPKSFGPPSSPASARPL
jgi:hypothetical protein